jgi:putative SOS response-associated peptidase YedK
MATTDMLHPVGSDEVQWVTDMCYSAQIWGDFRKYVRLGGDLNIREFTKLAGWTRKKGTWVKVVPKAMRSSMQDDAGGTIPPETSELAQMAEAEARSQISAEIELLEARLATAEAKLASPKPTKKAENDRRIARNKIASAQKRLADLSGPGPADGIDRIWPGHFAPVLIRNPETGTREIVPMRYRCRLPGWSEADELEKPGTYNARRDSLSTAWRRVFGVHHGVIGVHRFYESVLLNDLQQRALVPGEREQKVEVMFTPQTGEDLLVACLWSYTGEVGDQPGFYSFAVITDHPPAEVASAGHDRCIVSLREDDLDAWLSPTTQSPAALQAILDRGEAVRPYFEHELAA